MGVVLLVRHGQASFGAADYDVLSSTGAEQSRRLGRALAGQGVLPDVLVHGAMRRQRETAEELSLAAGWSVRHQRDPRWDEFDHLAVMARHDGDGFQAARELDRRAFQERFEQATGRWTSGRHDADYEESFPGFVARVGDALREAARAAGPGSTVLVVSSGGPIAVAAASLMQVPSRPTEIGTAWHRLNAVMVNASVSRVVVGSTGARLLTFNEHAFLPSDQVTYR